MKKLTSLLALVLTISFFLTSCQQESMEMQAARGSQASSGQGNLKVKMTDAPGNFDALRVEIERVEVYSENSGWVTLNAQPQIISILDLTNGTTAALNTNAGTAVSAGTYTMVKLVLGTEKNELELDGRVGFNGIYVDTANLLELGLEGPREIIIEVDEDVEEGEDAEILLDFDAAASVQQRVTQGGLFLYEYALAPVITFVDDYTTGIRGDVSGTANAAIKLSGTTGEYSTFISTTGDFLIQGVEEGEYDLEIIPALLNGDLASNVDPIVIENVFIAEGNILTMGTISAAR